MAYRRRRSRRFRRSKSIARRALRLARSVSRKVAGEVKKYDTQANVTQANFTTFGTKNSCLLVDIVDNALGTSNADFIGNQIRLKYLYLNLRFVLPKDGSVTIGERAAMWRVLIVQDTSQQTTAQDASTMLLNLFGYGAGTNPDLSVLPINPMQPGRWRVLDDSYVRLSDGNQQDYMYRRYFYQRRFHGQGRIYYGTNTTIPASETSGRNHVYAVVIYCPPYQLGSPDDTSLLQNFNVMYMSRMAYYDN